MPTGVEASGERHPAAGRPAPPSAARIYAAGMILYGQRPGLRSIWRMARSGMQLQEIGRSEDREVDLLVRPMNW